MLSGHTVAQIRNHIHKNFVMLDLQGRPFYGTNKQRLSKDLSSNSLLTGHVYILLNHLSSLKH